MRYKFKPFKIGDKVKVTYGVHKGFSGVIANVQAIDVKGDLYRYDVFDPGKTLITSMAHNHLEKIFSAKQLRSRNRNFQKMRLSGFFIDATNLTEPEKEQWAIIRRSINNMLEHWDSQSELLGIKVLPYKCHFCGRKSNTPHTLVTPQGETVNCCKKHFEDFSSESE